MLQKKLLKALGKAKDFNFKKYFKFFPAIVFLIILGSFFPSSFAHAGFTEFIMEHTIFPILYAVFSILLGVAWVITDIAAYTLNATLNPAIMNSVFANPAIYWGWTLIRDICNLLFLLLLLLVAFGTIVQSSKYNIKNSLAKLILALFLINLSWVVAGAIIDFGNILMYGILKWMCVSQTTCFQDYMGGLMRVADKFADKYNLIKLGDWWVGIKPPQVIGAAIAMVYVFMYGFILLALAAFLIVRTAALALLLILAPFAYFGEVMPGMEKVSSKWWDSVWSYSLFGPIFALMLYISGELAKITMDVPQITDTNLGWYSGTIVIIISNSLPLLFLLGIIPVTKSLGLAGTSTILQNTTGLGEKVLTGSAAYIGSSADRWAARGAQDQRKGVWGSLNRTRAYLSPGAWKRAYKASESEKEHSYDMAAGKMREKVYQRGPIKYGDEAYDREVSRHQQDIKGKNKIELVHLMEDALDKRMVERAEGIARELAAKSDMNEAYTRIKDKEGNFYQNTPDGFGKFMQEKFEPKLGTDKTGRLMADLAELEKRDGQHSFKGSSKFNSETGKFEITDRDEREREAAKEFGTVESQGKWKNMDSRTLLDQQYSKDGKPIEDAEGNATWKFGDRGMYILNDMTSKDLENAWKGKAKHQRRLLSALEDKGEMKRLEEMSKKDKKFANAYRNAEELRKNLQKAIRGKTGTTSSIQSNESAGEGEGRKTRRIRKGQQTLSGEKAETEEEGAETPPESEENLGEDED